MKFLIVTDYLDFVGGGFEPLGVLSIAAVVQQAGHEVRMVTDKYELCVGAIESWNPEMVGYCIFTGYHKNLIELNRKLKENFDFISVFGGPHATFFPEIIDQHPSIDLVSRGESEWAILEMIERIEQRQDFSDVQNFWVRKNGEIFRNPVRPLEMDLDRIPFPAHDLFYQFPEARRGKIRVIMTARGCPYSCTYCYNYKMKELYKDCGVNHLRHRSVDNTLEEIRYLKKNFPFDLVYFGTDCFTANKDWVYEFCEKYPREFDMKFTCASRPETADPDVMKALKEAGCFCIFMGLESGDDAFRKRMLNRRMADERILQAAENIHNAGLNLYTFNMMGLPGETLEQAYKTIDLNIRTKTDYTWVSTFQPYPRTKLTDYAIEKGYFNGDFDKVPMGWYGRSALNSPIKSELERLRTLASLMVEWPWLYRFRSRLVKLPLDGFYRFIWKIHKVYCYRYRVLPVKFSLKEIIQLGWNYLFDKTAE
ncbi:B12-binding domain-containing radical SAM protein [bacterium]|nr:B12-binding domain-containing radical SAM protein [bacterium]